MKWWPWSKEKLETRSSQPYSDIILTALEAQASGSGAGDSLKIAALEAAAGQYARAFMACEVSARQSIKNVLMPSLLSLIARNLIRYGENVHVIDVQDGKLSLLPCGSWDVQGGTHETEWTYQCHLYGPSGSLSKYVPSDSVIHVRYAIDPVRPWNGISPLEWASTTGKLAGNLETSIGYDVSGPTGYVLPVPVDSSPKSDATGPLDGLRTDIKNLKGKTVLVETTSGGWGEGRTGAPQKDWISSRIGSNPPQVLAALQTQVGQSILAACGCPPELFSDKGSSQGAREAWRRFCFGSVQPLARLIEEELSRKLDDDVSLSFNGLFAHDIAGRASAFAKMVQSGMPLEKAVAISGLMALDGD